MSVDFQVQYRDFFERREELKKDYEEYFEKSMTKKYKPEPQIIQKWGSKKNKKALRHGQYFCMQSVESLVGYIVSK